MPLAHLIDLILILMESIFALENNGRCPSIIGNFGFQLSEVLADIVYLFVHRTLLKTILDVGRALFEDFLSFFLSLQNLLGFGKPIILVVPHLIEFFLHIFASTN